MSDVSNLEIGASSDAWDTRKWLIQVDSFGKQMTARHELKSLLTNFLVRKNGLQFWYDLIDFSTTNKNPRRFAGTKNATGRPWSGNPRSLLAFGMKLPQWTTRWLGRLRCLFLGPCRWWLLLNHREVSTQKQQISIDYLFMEDEVDSNKV